MFIIFFLQLSRINIQYLSWKSNLHFQKSVLLQQF